MIQLGRIDSPCVLSSPFTVQSVVCLFCDLVCESKHKTKSYIMRTYTAHTYFRSNVQFKKQYFYKLYAMRRRDVKKYYLFREEWIVRQRPQES